VNVNARLGVVPAASAAIRKATRFRAAVIGVFGVEEIVELA